MLVVSGFHAKHGRFSTVDVIYFRLYGLLFESVHCVSNINLIFLSPMDLSRSLLSLQYNPDRWNISQHRPGKWRGGEFRPHPLTRAEALVIVTVSGGGQYFYSSEHFLLGNRVR